VWAGTVSYFQAASFRHSLMSDSGSGRTKTAHFPDSVVASAAWPSFLSRSTAALSWAWRTSNSFSRLRGSWSWFSNLQSLVSAVTQRSFGLNRSNRLLQAVVHGHEFETLNPFSGQNEGRQMKGVQSSQ
jgi:hypothetical protein